MYASDLKRKTTRREVKGVTSDITLAADMSAETMDIDGPECGTALARTYVRWTYSIGGGLMVDRSRFCCNRHILRPEQVLPDSAVLEEIAIEDGLYRTVVTLNEITGRAHTAVTAIEPAA